MNALLQGKRRVNYFFVNNSEGPYFTEVDLMRFAQELDEQERQVMAEKGTDTKEFLEYMRVRDLFKIFCNICRMIVRT
jgi:hypothetical protein